MLNAEFVEWKNNSIQFSKHRHPLALTPKVPKRIAMEKAECRAKLSTQPSELSTHSVSFALKHKEPCSLEGQLSPVALDQITELAVGNMELQPVAAFKLEGGVVGGGAVAVA